MRTGMSCINTAVPTFHFWFSSYCHITFTSHTHFKQYQKKVRKCLRSTRKNTATSLHSVKVTGIQEWPYLRSEISQSVLWHWPVVVFCLVYHYTTLARLLADMHPAIYAVLLELSSMISSHFLWQLLVVWSFNPFYSIFIYCADLSYS